MEHDPKKKLIKSFVQKMQSLFFRATFFPTFFFGTHDPTCEQEKDRVNPKEKIKD